MPPKRAEPECRCAVRDVLDRVGDKWSVQVIGLLAVRPMRFNELLHAIERISQRMLSITLRGLERDGLVVRTVTADRPARIAYALTPLGDTLRDPICALASWAEDHRQNVDTARSLYDRQAKKRASR